MRDSEALNQYRLNPSPENMALLLKSLNPLILSEVNKYTQSGVDLLTLKAKAIDLLFNALPKYNPAVSQLNTFVINNLRPLSRYVNNNQNIIRVSEHTNQAYRKLNATRIELSENLGRELTDEDIRTHLGVHKLQDFKPFAEHYYSKGGDESGSSFSPAMEELTNTIATDYMVLDMLTDKQKEMFHYFKTNPTATGKDAAKHFGISAPAISKHRRLIDKKVKTVYKGLERLGI